MFDKSLIMSKFGAAVKEDERRALFVHLFDEFVHANLKLQQPFDEPAHRGKVVFDKIFAHFELRKIADFLLDVPVAQIKLLTKEMEQQKWLFHDDQRELEVYVEHDGWERFVDKHDQNSDKLIVGFVSYLNQRHVTMAPGHRAPDANNGTLAYAFLKLKFHNSQELGRLARSDFLDLLAYLRVACVDFFHDRVEPALLRLRAEQFASFGQLPAEVRAFAHSAPWQNGGSSVPDAI